MTDQQTTELKPLSELELKRMLHLPTTDEKRLAIQATRPEGCTCLGLGWTEERYNKWGNLVHTYCTCPDGIRVENEDEIEREARIKEQKKQFVLNQVSKLPERFHTWRLSTSPLIKTMPELIKKLTMPSKEEIEKDADDLWEGMCGSWYFWGSYGTGKTGLAISYALQRAHLEESIIYQPIPDLLSELRSSYNHSEGLTEAELLNKYKVPDSLLILDDLGAEHVKGTGWVEDRLYQIIGYRHAHLQDCIFTSNLSPQKLAEHIGERIVWRIIEMCGADHIIKIEGPNLRDVKHKQ